MGLVDNLRKATGIGLTNSEHYQRAYEKGVLLGPAKYGDAVALFDTAAKKASDVGDVGLQLRATANARLYQFITTGDPRLLPELRNALSQIQEIEVIGSRTDTMAAATLLAEVDARWCEAQLQGKPIEDYPGRATLHRRASDTFKQIFQAQLTTYRWQSSDMHVDTAQSRFFYHVGSASWNDAMLHSREDPERAAEHMAKALSAFRQCGDSVYASQADSWLAKYRARRTCWMCHREMQGADVHFRVVTAQVAPYVVATISRLGQDPSSVSVERSEIVLCTPCDTSVRYLADQLACQRAQEVRAELGARLHAAEAALEALRARLNAMTILR